MLRRWFATIAMASGCASVQLDNGETVLVRAGDFDMGSTPHDRAVALESAASRGADVRPLVSRLRDELPQRNVGLGSFAIMVHPVTQADYAAYVYETGVAEPWVDPATWARTDHPSDDDPKLVAWRDGRPQSSLMDQPAVLVSQREAAAYCEWWAKKYRGHGALPSEAQWERAAQSVLEGIGPEWTGVIDDGRAIVKGGDQRDPIGSRPAARRFLPAETRQASVGFRCVLAPKDAR